MKIQLRDSSETYNFYPGVELILTETGQIRPATRWERLRSRLADRARAATRWFRPRTVVTEIDHDAGTVTMADERWSWRRWRWEP